MYTVCCANHCAVGLSRNPTEDPKRPRKSSSIHRRSMSIQSNGSRPPTADRVRRPSAATPSGETPFDPEDLEAALQKTTLDTTKEESDRSGDISPNNHLDHPMVQPLPEPEHGQDFYDRLRPRERLIAFDDDHTFGSIDTTPRSGTY